MAGAAMWCELLGDWPEALAPAVLEGTEGRGEAAELGAVASREEVAGESASSRLQGLSGGSRPGHPAPKLCVFITLNVGREEVPGSGKQCGEAEHKKRAFSRCNFHSRLPERHPGIKLSCGLGYLTWVLTCAF